MDVVINSGKRIVPLSECIGDPNIHNNPILTTFFKKGGLFEQYTTGTPVVCQPEFAFGTDYWGVDGCIWQKSCPQGGSWSVAEKKCSCLPDTPIWDNAAFK
ncbi:UNVERIFIED_CONTAM: hypothetical protein HDU68_006540, partial [Siphonaria sp. JEL0065]